MGAYVPLVSYVTWTQLPGVSMVPAFPTAGTPPSGYAPTNNLSEIYQANQPLHTQNFPEQYWNLVGGGPQQLLCGMVAAPAPQIDFVGTQFSAPVGNANFPTSPMHCALAINNNSCSQILYQPTQAAGNMAQNWQPGLPLTIEGTGFGFLPEMTLPYATTSWGSTPYLTIEDVNPQNQFVNWSSPNSQCQMLILNWSPTTITVVPNVETHMYDGSNTLVSPLTDTSPFSLSASTSCAVILGDSITVTVTNPQNITQQSTLKNQPVNAYTGNLN